MRVTNIHSFDCGVGAYFIPSLWFPEPPYDPGRSGFPNPVRGRSPTQVGGRSFSVSLPRLVASLSCGQHALATLEFAPALAITVGMVTLQLCVWMF